MLGLILTEDPQYVFSIQGRKNLPHSSSSSEAYKNVGYLHLSQQLTDIRLSTQRPTDKTANYKATGV
ncbi:MAG: hypothetical protein ACAF41_05645 [Leptolyngbya sp. BL-A-14]